MKSGTGFILLIGFGTLLVLIGFMTVSAYWKAERLNADMAEIHDSLTNCARHARARSVRVTLRGGDGGLTIRIRADGVAFGPAVLRRKGIGLVAMDERVRELGGEISVESRPNMGTMLEKSFPFVHNRMS